MIPLRVGDSNASPLGSRSERISGYRIGTLVSGRRGRGKMVEKRKRAALAALLNSNGADNGTRTRDPNLGKVVLYQLSHVRARQKY